METPRSQTKVAMTFGAVYGMAVIALMLIFYFTGIDYQSRIPSLIQYAVQIVVIAIAIKSYRDQDLGGYIKYSKALGTGTLTSIFGGALVGGFTIILMYYIAPEMIETIMTKVQENMEAQGTMTEDQLQMGLSWTRKMMQPLPLFIFGIIGSGIMGFIFSLVVSVFLKKDNPNPFSSENNA